MDLRDLKHTIEDFDLQRFREGPHAKTAVGVAVVAVLFLVFVLTRCGGGRAAAPSSSEQYFFDLNTGQLVAVPLSVYGPTDVGNGTFDFGDGTFGSAVKAEVVSCNDCLDVAPGMTREQLKAVDAQIAYLTRYPPAEREIFVKGQTGETLTNEEFDVMDSAELLYSTSAGKTWLPRSSGPATKLAREAYSGCGDRRLQRCSP